MTSSKRALLATVCPAMSFLAILRHRACYAPIQDLQAVRPPPAGFPLAPQRPWLFASALCIFRFHYPAMIQWLGGEYVPRDTSWAAFRSRLADTAAIAPPPGYQVVDLHLATRILSEGVPLAGHYACDYNDVRRRHLHNTHPPCQVFHDEIRAKLYQEEERSYHVLFPRPLWRFLYGLHLSFMTWVVRRGKGRIVIDPSTPLSPSDTGAANAAIPEPAVDSLECPQVYYGNALLRHWQHIWNMRISFPTEDILLYKDDIEAAFHRIHYNPVAAIAFAYVFSEFLVIPVGMIFGARNSPSYFCVTSELRAHVASYDAALRALPLEPHAASIELPDPPDPLEVEAMANIAVPDGINRGIQEPLRTHNVTFVDDNLIAATRSLIRSAIHLSIEACYLVYGYPDDDRRGPPLAADKLLSAAHYIMEHLGFLIDTRKLTVSWPVSRRLELQDQLRSIGFPTRAIKPIAPRVLASIVGRLRSATAVAPLGVFRSLRLQQLLNTFISSSTVAPRQAWRTRRPLFVASELMAELNDVFHTLSAAPEHPAWCRSLGCLIPREPHILGLTDASPDGMGGYCIALKCMWRLSRQDLLSLGFDLQALQEFRDEPVPGSPGLHINCLELVAMIINLWLILRFARTQDPHPGGLIIHIRGDNTTALSWFSHAARSHSAPVRRLTRFAAALLTFNDLQVQLTSSHIRGIHNVGADALSRPSRFPTWASVIRQCSELATCTAYHLPLPVLSLLSSFLSCKPPEGRLETLTTRLWTLAVPSLPPGATDTTSMPPRSPPSRGRRSRR